ncbi:MAG: ribokinase [Alkalispirochaeta sp.]
MSTTWVVGSLNIDLVAQVPRFPQPGETIRGSSFATFLGGKGGNQAMSLCRLGAAPRMVGRVGDDEFGTRYRSALTDAGGNIDHVRPVPGTTTGTAVIEVDAEGQNHIVIVPGANGSMTVDSVLPDIDEVGPGDLVLLQLEIPFDTVWEVARFADSRGATVILDPAPAAEIPEHVLRAIGWITPNEHEASIITGVDTSSEEGLTNACRALLEAGVTHAVIKAGKRGAVYAHRDQPEPQLIPGFAVDAVDTTAAGDSFNGGLAWALGRGMDPEEALHHANAVAALSVTGMGAQTAMPTADAVQTFLK